MRIAVQILSQVVCGAFVLRYGRRRAALSTNGCLLAAILATLSAGGCSSFGGNLAKSPEIGPEPRQGAVSQVGYEEPVASAATEAEQDEGFKISDLSPSAVAQNAKDTAKWLSGKSVNEALARGLFQEAEDEYVEAGRASGQDRIKLYKSAAEKFETAAIRWPNSPLQHDALFLSGESYFFSDHYWDANEQFKQLLSLYPNTRHLDTLEARRFSIAHYWQETHQANPQSIFTFNLFDERRPTRDAYGHSLRVYDNIRIEDPTGRLADDATLAAANAHFLAGDYLKADGFYTDLRRAFPSSEHQFVAHFMGAKSKLLSYQGADYSGDALDDTEKLIKTMRRQFPVESEKRRDEIELAYAEVKKAKAEREWRTATFYDNRHEFGAARLSYQTIVTEFDGTPHADRARTRLAEISSRPAVPPQRLKWLVNLFPSEQDEIPKIANQPLANQ